MAEHLASFPSLASSGPSSIGSEGHVTLGEEDPEFVNEADRSRFLCPVHNGVLREIRQTLCGHRLCARYVVEKEKEKKSNVQMNRKGMYQ